MQGYGPNARQERAVVKEWREALEDGRLDIAERIATANPDLFEVTAWGHAPRKEQ